MLPLLFTVGTLVLTSGTVVSEVVLEVLAQDLERFVVFGAFVIAR